MTAPKPFTKEEIASLRSWWTGHEVEGWAELQLSYELMQQLLDVAEDHARLVERDSRQKGWHGHWTDVHHNDVVAERDTLRVQLDEARREVERLTTIMGGDLGKRLLLLVEKHEITADALDAAHAQIEKLREAAQDLLTKLTRGNPKYADVWLCKPSDVDALLAALADPTDTGEGK